MSPYDKYLVEHLNDAISGINKDLKEIETKNIDLAQEKAEFFDLDLPCCIELVEFELH